MKRLLLTLLATLSFHSFANAQTNAEFSIELTAPLAGTDFPTDVPEPKFLRDKLILTVNETSRIVVEGEAQLANAEAGEGVDLLLQNDTRIPVKIEQALAGIDFPTDGPANLDRDFLVWNFGKGQRVRLNSIKTIELAVAGIDYPTDGPADLDRSFYVYTSYNKDFSLRRTVIRSTQNAK